MPVDKFGRMSDAKTKDTGVSLTYINNNYIRSDGGTPVSGSIDMRGNTLYNSVLSKKSRRCSYQGLCRLCTIYYKGLCGLY